MAVIKTILRNAGVSSSASICGSTVLGLAAYGNAEETLRHSCLVMKIRRGTIIHFMKGVVVCVSHTHKLFETWQRGTRLSWRRAKQVASGKYFILFGNFIRCELLFSLQNGPINWNSCSCSWFRKVDSTGWWQHMNRKILYWSIQPRMYFSCQPSQVKSPIMNPSVWPNRRHECEVYPWEVYPPNDSTWPSLK